MFRLSVLESQLFKNFQNQYGRMIMPIYTSVHKKKIEANLVKEYHRYSKYTIQKKIDNALIAYMHILQ